MNLESNRQDLASRLVKNEIYYCVSSLVGTLNKLVQYSPSDVLSDECLSWEEDILPLLESIDYEEAGTQAINDCDDLDTLETMAEGVGYWSDAIEQTGFDDTQEYADSDGEMDTVDFETWFEDHCTDDERASALDVLRAYIAHTCTDWGEFCRDNNVDTDDFHSEVYEHWIVSDWLARRLKERDHVVGEVCGLTIWGRQGTGQSIYLDRVIQEIACETWPEEVLHEQP